jgi:hypothetical protein
VRIAILEYRSYALQKALQKANKSQSFIMDMDSVFNFVGKLCGESE